MSSKSWFTGIITRASGEVEVRSENPNLRTNAGADWQANVMAATSAQPPAANFMALTSDATASAATDTALASEYTSNGLGRAQGTFTHTTGTSTYTLAHTFTCSGVGQVIAKEGIFTAVSSGTLVFESAEPTPPTLNVGDTLTQTCQVSI